MKGGPTRLGVPRRGASRACVWGSPGVRVGGGAAFYGSWHGRAVSGGGAGGAWREREREITCPQDRCCSLAPGRTSDISQDDATCISNDARGNKDELLAQLATCSTAPSSRAGSKPFSERVLCQSNVNCAHGAEPFCARWTVLKAALGYGSGSVIQFDVRGCGAAAGPLLHRTALTRQEPHDAAASPSGPATAAGLQRLRNPDLRPHLPRTAPARWRIPEAPSSG